MNSSPTLLIFDLDDTLIDTSRGFYDLREAFVVLLVEKGMSEERVRETLSKIEEVNIERYGYVSERNLVSMRETYEALTVGTDVRIQSADLRRIARLGSKCLYEIPKPMPGARRLLPWCATRFTCAMLTRGSHALQEAKVEGLHVRQYLASVTVVAKKTAGSFADVAHSLGHDPAQCISIGDSMRFDVSTALEAGMSAIHVVYPHPDIQWVHDYAPSVVSPRWRPAAGLAAVRTLLEQWSSASGTFE